MLTKNMYMLIGALVVLAIGVFVYGSYTKDSASAETERTGTERLSAEEVVDLEVQAQQEFEAAGGVY